MAKIKINDELMKKLNHAREDYDGKLMSLEELKKAIKQIGLPTSPTFISNMMKGINPPLSKWGKNYKFNDKPIHIEMMKLIVKKYEDIVTAPKSSAKPVKTSKTDEIAAAITLLKAHGYKIGKPNVTYEWL